MSENDDILNEKSLEDLLAFLRGASKEELDSFSVFTKACCANDALVQEFDRLTHSNLHPSKPTILRNIDVVCGRMSQSVVMFMLFVYDQYQRLPKEAVQDG